MTVPIYILFNDYESPNQCNILCYEHNKYSSVTSNMKAGIILVLEENCIPQGEYLYFKHNMKNFIYLPRFIENLPYDSLIFYLERVTVVFKKSFLDSSYYSLLMGPRQKELIKEFSQGELHLIVSDSNLGDFLAQATMKNNYNKLSISLIFLIRKYSFAAGVLCLLLLVVNLYLGFILKRG